jgi:hypothetical protein
LGTQAPIPTTDRVHTSIPCHRDRAAIVGDRTALEQLTRYLLDLAYRLALRSLAEERESADATQEIVISAITHLPQFEFRAAGQAGPDYPAANPLLTGCPGDGSLDPKGRWLNHGRRLSLCSQRFRWAL